MNENGSFIKIECELSENNSLHRQSSVPTKQLFIESFCFDLLNVSIMRTHILNENFILCAAMYFFSRIYETLAYIKPGNFPENGIKTPLNNVVP